ncbi:cholesterol oxidase [Myxococcaceae bacterium]|nr:cholesterol oxidase [Myxococcaceae bacterium]
MTGEVDVIVIGSGFGGAVMACRLAEAGARVVVLERGRRWTPEQYPRKPEDPWFYHHSQPHKLDGWLDLRLLKGMAVALGAGVGGGSLCYSSVVMKADPEYFDGGGWPAEITYSELLPYYDKVHAMMGVNDIPAGQHTHRFQLLQQAADKLGYGDRFRSMPLALTFDPAYHYGLPDPLDHKHSKPFTNPQGKRQGTCVHLGNCDIGCDVQAKNALDFNYIPAAENHGADVRPLHLVRYVEPVAGGYRVVFDRIENGQLVPGSLTGKRVVISAGSLGSTEILLRSRDQYRTLPAVSQTLGSNWSPNANFLTPDLYADPAKIHQGIGPTISAGVDFMDGALGGKRFIIEDDGFPNLFLNAVLAKLRSAPLSPAGWALRTAFQRGFNEKNPMDRVMVWLGAGVDAGDGRLHLGRDWLAPWKQELKLDWDVRRSEGVIDAILDLHKRLSEASGGHLQVPVYWRLFKNLVTVHPLGGCKMGGDAGTGVVDHRGQVFGYENLYVADGSVLPSPVGRNPSMTIAALAERSARLLADGIA